MVSAGSHNASAVDKAATVNLKGKKKTKNKDMYFSSLHFFFPRGTLIQHASKS